jgi:hypothetical protein
VDRAAKVDVQGRGHTDHQLAGHQRIQRGQQFGFDNLVLGKAGNVDLIPIALSSLSAALGAVCVYVLSGLRDDVREIRNQTGQNCEAIAELKGRFNRSSAYDSGDQ